LGGPKNKTADVYKCGKARRPSQARNLERVTSRYKEKGLKTKTRRRKERLPTRISTQNKRDLEAVGEKKEKNHVSRTHELVQGRGKSRDQTGRDQRRREGFSKISTKKKDGEHRKASLSQRENEGRQLMEWTKEGL